MRCMNGSSKTQTAVSNAGRILNLGVALPIGFCASMKPTKAKLGNVITSAKLVTFDEKIKREDDSHGTDEYHNINVDAGVNMTRLRPYGGHEWQTPLQDSTESLKVQAHCHGVMLNGPELVHNP